MHQAITHPILQHKLTVLRDRRTGNKEFRELISEITAFLAYEALKHVAVEDLQIETPIAPTVGKRIRNDIVVVPVLRAGVGMLHSLCTLLPMARVGFVGVYRDHDTKLPVQYYAKLPPAQNDPIAFVLDPMLATGGSTNAVIDLLKQNHFPVVVLLAVVSAPEGIRAVEARHPDVAIYTAAVDECLNADKYIVPGLGDAGDRLFGTQ
jgi:uracil phosphoribosyltransferase